MRMLPAGVRKTTAETPGSSPSTQMIFTPSKSSTVSTSRRTGSRSPHSSIASTLMSRPPALGC